MINKSMCVCLILISIVALRAEKAEYNPSIVTKDDLETLKTLPQDIYRHANKTHRKTPSEILEFVWQNRLIKINPLYERVQIGVVGFGGGRNLNGGIYNLENDSNLDPYAYVGIQGRLNILDPLESRQKQQEIQKQRIEILNIIVAIQSAKADYYSNSHALQILNLKETRLKVRVDQAVSNLDERIKNLESIHETQQNLNKAFLEFQRRKAQLLEYIKGESKAELESIIGGL